MRKKKKNKAFFFDRDGIVNVRLVGDYVKNIDEFEFIPEFFSIFKLIKSLGYLVILITNQQGVGKGLMTNENLEEIHRYMQVKIKQETGFSFDDIFVSTDLADSGSWRRKPNPGMILEAMDKNNIDTHNSWIIGDSPSDAIAGKSVGLSTIFVGKFSKEEQPKADFIFENLAQVRTFIENNFR
jgi:D-glycero-D-manno-heptose 1,7-bisphosphate phosphatase